MCVYKRLTIFPSLSLEILYRLGLKVPPPQSYSSLGFLGFPLDGNLIGGAILGVGMSLSASCPGMVFPQLAMGVPSAPMTVAGAFFGGVLWSAVLRPWVAVRNQQRLDGTAGNQRQQQEQGQGQEQIQQQQRQKQRQKQQKQPPRTLAELAGTDRTTTLLVYEAVLITAVAAAAIKAPSAPSTLHPVVGGVAIGGAQLVSLLLRGSLLGASTCYEHMGDWAVYLLYHLPCQGRRGQGKGGKGSSSRPPVFSMLLFAGAMMAGAWLLARLTPRWWGATLDSTAAAAPSPVSSPLGAFAGGFLMAVGSRVGGGCASGHGISGMGLMSVSSFVTMFGTFAAAISVSLLAR